MSRMKRRAPFRVSRGKNVTPAIAHAKEAIMIDRAALCEKIRTIYPDIGECSIDIDVVYDNDRKAWVVQLKKEGHELKTYLEDGDAEMCMLGRQCVSLGIEIAQLKGNIERLPRDR